MRLVRPSVCPVRAPKSKTKKTLKIEISKDVPQGTSKWTVNFPIFQMKKSKVKVIGGQKSPQQSGVMFTYGQPLFRRQLQGGRGLEFPSVTQSVARPHTMSAVGADIFACS